MYCHQKHIYIIPRLKCTSSLRAKQSNPEKKIFPFNRGIVLVTHSLYPIIFKKSPKNVLTKKIPFPTLLFIKKFIFVPDRLFEGEN